MYYEWDQYLVDTESNNPDYDPSFVGLPQSVAYAKLSKTQTFAEILAKIQAELLDQ